MYCEKCASTNCNCGCLEGKPCTCKPAGEKRAYLILNWAMLVLVAVLTVVATVTFFIATFTEGNDNNYSIASMYVLVMLLGAPTLKVFLDKVKCLTLKKLNVITLAIVFGAILVQAMTAVITLAI
jgi:hypothetical protein